MVALVQWSRLTMRGSRAGAALAASDREGVDAACRSMTATWAIERAERAQRRWGGGGRGEVAGMPSLVGLRRRWTTMVRMMTESGGTKQQPTP